MILKRLFDEYELPIERILLKEYKRLDLKTEEAIVLIALFQIFKKRRSFSLYAIAKRVEYSQNKIGTIVESLLEKDFIEIQLESKDGKEREVFDLDKTFKKIEKLFYDDEKERMLQLKQSQISLTIDRFEKGMGRSLLPFELENIRTWYEEQTYSHEGIMHAIDLSLDRLSVKYVEKHLTKENIKTVEIDPEIDQALDEIYKRIK